MSGTDMTRCAACEAANPAAYHFCGECGTRLPAARWTCGHASPPGQRFCGECGAPRIDALERTGVGDAAPEVAARLADIAAYTPKHLAEKILRTRSAIQGERKLVTVMFSDVSGFTAMSERLDPEEVHAIMDRAFQVIIEAVHRLRGHHQPVPGRWRDGALRRADRPRGPPPPRAFAPRSPSRTGSTPLKRRCGRPTG